METNEIWVPVVGWERLYEVSDRGRVRSLEREVDGGGFLYRRPGKILAERLGASGRPRVSLCVKAKAIDRFIHVLVLEAFVGPRPEGFDCCHNDGNQLNNRLENLRWDTKKNNQADRIRHGTMLYGEENPSSKLTEEIIAKILADGRKQKDIASEYGIVQQTVSKIKRGKLWGRKKDEVRFSIDPREVGTA